MSYTVWTRIDEPADVNLIDRNAGINEFIVATNLPYRQSALALQRRLVELYGDDESWIEEN